MKYRRHSKQEYDSREDEKYVEQPKYNHEDKEDYKPQGHVHEFLGSTRLAELEEDPHNHRFAGVSGQEIKVTGGHVHKVKARTDFYEDHFHEFAETSGLQKPVGDGIRHVHFVEGTTTPANSDGHTHDLIFATLIENPIEEEEV